MTQPTDPPLRVRIVLTVTAETAVSVGAGGSAGTLADKAIVRDGWGRPIIPGSQVKGKVRHAAEAIAGALGLAVQKHFDDDDSEMNVIRAIFGSPRHRSPLRFVDLVGFAGGVEQLDQPRALQWREIAMLRPSVSINRRRGAAEDARLLLQEAAPEGLRFGAAQAISGTLPDLTYVALLWVALCSITRWGGAKSRGLGWSSVAAEVYVDDQPVDIAALSQALRELNAQRRSG